MKHTPLSVDEKFDSITASMERLDIPLDDASLSAAENVAKRLVLPLGVSGKIASGKDSVTEASLSKLEIDSSHHFFARVAKDELSQILAITSDASSIRKAALAISSEQNVNLQDAERAARFAEAALLENPEASGYTRGSKHRTLILCWTNEIRRAQDPLYFAKKLGESAIKDLSQGKNVHVSDVRYRNEISVLEALSFLVMRVDVSPAVQAQRLMKRDGIAPDPSVISDLSETDLDSYDRFTLRVSNDGLMQDAVDPIVLYSENYLQFKN